MPPHRRTTPRLSSPRSAWSPWPRSGLPSHSGGVPCRTRPSAWTIAAHERIGMLEIPMDREKSDEQDTNEWHARAEACRKVTAMFMDEDSRNRLLRKVAEYERRACEADRERGSLP